MTRELAQAVAEVAGTHRGECVVRGDRPGRFPKGEGHGVYIPATGTTYWDYAAVAADHPDWHTLVQHSDQEEKGFEP